MSLFLKLQFINIYSFDEYISTLIEKLHLKNYVYVNR